MFLYLPIRLLALTEASGGGWEGQTEGMKKLKMLFLDTLNILAFLNIDT